MIDLIALVGQKTLAWLRALGLAARFFVDLLRYSPVALRRFGLVVTQIHAIGNRSLSIICASGLAVGFVLALQLYYVLTTFGAAGSLGLVVNLALMRELGPVIAALLFAGRAGTSLTAEIGLMKAGEQLAAMELMAVDPRARVLAPRFLGGIIAVPLLTALFCAVGIMGAYVVAVLMIGIDAGEFWGGMQSRVDVLHDVGNGILKGVVFGFLCTFIALFQGYQATPTPGGVAYATTRGVVVSSLLVLAMDFLLTAVMFSSR